MAAEPKKSHLALVPAAEPGPVEQVRLRIKKLPRPDGLLQCNHCGCRTSIRLMNGVAIVNGRKKGGTLIHEDICSECWRRGSIMSMLPQIKPAT